MSALFWAIIDLFAVVFLFFLNTKIPLRFPSLLSSQELSSVFAFAEPCGQNCHNITSSKKLLHSCFLPPIRIIFCFSLLTLRSSRALSILNSAESAIIFPKSLPSDPWENCEGWSNVIDICMALDQSIFSAQWCVDCSKYRGFLAGSMSCPHSLF